MPGSPPPASALPPTSGPVDALILCALQDELEGLLAVEGGRQHWEERRDHRQFRVYQRVLDNGRGGRLRVAAAWTGEMGRTDTAIRAQELIDELSPACLAMCGICAGDRKKVSLGDVIVADRLWSYDEGKLTASGFSHDVVTYNLTAAWKMDAAHLDREIDLSALKALRPRSRASQRRWLLNALLEHEDTGGAAPASHPDRKSRCAGWTEVVQEAEKDGLVAVRARALALTERGRDLAEKALVYHPDGLPEDPEFKIVVGPIATGAGVREVSAPFDDLRLAGRKSIGLDMEAAAIGKIAERHMKRALVVKAVSDHADAEKDDSFREFACRASAEVLLAFLLKHLDPEQTRTDPKVLMRHLEVLEEEVEKGFKTEQERASALFDSGHYAKARDLYREMYDHAKRTAEETGRPRLRAWAERCLLNVAVATVNLHEIDEARRQLATLEAELLSPHGRVNLAEALAVVGEIDEAEATLAAVDLRDDAKLQERATEVRQRIEIRRGQVPPILVQAATVKLDAVMAHLANDDLAAASTLAMDILKTDGDHVLIAADAAAMLTDALVRTIFENPPHARLVAVDQRADILELLEATFDRIQCDALPAATLADYDHAEAAFRHLTHDDDRLAERFAAQGSSQQGDHDDGRRQRAFRLALEGRPDDAIQALPSDTARHPWRGRLDRIELLAVGKQIDRALNEALDLAKDFPERVPIESITAQLCARAGRMEDALAHAHLAFRLLPGRGHRWFLATQYLVTDQPDRAWDLIKDVTDPRPRALHTRALVAEQTGRAIEAESAWRRYVEIRPEDALARVRYAQLLFRMHRIEESATVAWRLYTEHGERLDLESLYVCGALQRMAGSLDTEQTRRVRTVEQRISERFPDDARAEYLRLQLLIMLGNELPEDRTPINYAKLTEAGFLTPHPADALEDFVKQRSSFMDAVMQSANGGAIPTATGLRLVGTQLALFVTRILQHRQTTNSVFLCPPVSLSDQPPALLLGGATLVVSDLELLLLEVLDLTSALREALGANGRVRIFRFAEDRIREDFTRLHISARPTELSKADALIRQLGSIRTLEADPKAPYDDAAAARRGNATIVTDSAPEGTSRISPRQFVQYLCDAGCLDEEQRSRIIRRFADDPTLVPAATESRLDRIVLRWDIVEELFESGVLAPVARALGSRLFVGPQAQARFLGERAELEDTIRAEELAGRVCKRLSEGWIETVDAPAVNDVPPLRTPDDSLGDALVREPLREMLAYRYALIANPSWWRISADFFGTNAFGAPGFTDKLAWRSPQDFLMLMRKVRPAESREITMPALVRLLIANTTDADRRLITLAELGFPDALGSAELLRLERRYRGLNKAEPQRILANQEWMARSAAHLGGPYARTRLAQTYAHCIFRAFCDESGAPALGRSRGDQEAILRALLDRQEALSRGSCGNTVDQTLQFLALGTLGTPLAAWKRIEDQMMNDGEGPAALLWLAVGEWAKGDAGRRAAYDRALRETWLLMDQRKGDGPSIAESMTLAHVQPRSESRRSEFSFEIEPGLEALAILSGLWKDRPLVQSGLDVPGPKGPERFNFEEILNRGVSALASSSPAVRRGRVIEYALTLPGREGVLPVRAPVEAVFARAPWSVQAKVCDQLKGHQGRHDGALYQLLDELQSTRSKNRGRVLKRYMRRAASALFRLVREDPAFLCTWPQTHHISHGGAQPTISDLQKILSEPAEPLPEPLSSLFQLRRDGAWKPAARRDGEFLLMVTSEIPGTFVAAPTSWRMDVGYEQNVALALHRLDNSDDSPIARVACDVIFLRVAAMQRPDVKLPGGEVNLREILPARLNRLLERVAGPPEPGTFAATEAMLLRICGEVVQRLARPSVLPLREGLWLTWRLFQWLCLQLDAISLDARREGIQRMVAQAPPPQVRRDVLDPFGFGRDHPDYFDHRLGAVLHALNSMEEIVTVVGRESPAGESVKAGRVSSPELEDKLLRLAHGVHQAPPLDSVLDWDAPDNVPDLALNALLHLNAVRFAELSPEARTRRFNSLPDDPQALRDHDWRLSFAERILFVTGDVAANLTPEERALVEEKLRAMVDGPRSRRWRWVTIVSFFAAGADPLEAEAIALSMDHVADSVAEFVIGRLLLGVAARDPARIEPLMNDLLAEASRRALDRVVPLAVGVLGRLVVHGSPETQTVSADFLVRLAGREPFLNDPRVNELIGLFGLRDTGGEP